MKAPEKLYVVTGFNKLSEERMAITSPHELDVARRMRSLIARGLHRYSAYKELKVELENRQLEIF